MRALLLLNGPVNIDTAGGQNRAANVKDVDSRVNQLGMRLLLI